MDELQRLRSENQRLYRENVKLREVQDRVRALLNESCSALSPSATTSTINKEPTEIPSPVLCLNKPPLRRRLFVQKNQDESIPTKLKDEPGANKWEVLFDMFDKKPSKKEAPSYAYQEKTVRGKKRKALPGQTCYKCEGFYKAAGIEKKGINKCSKHRQQWARQPSPKGFWDLEFPSTQEIRARQSSPN
ncbi:DNA endonuclease RBBP8 [Frankliniella fusca]|uniref:DNA endonuclease RBBP8 n=1 Tax=Frankliniella fusca TaxID=407009 RepID=A0AAE1I2M6_9NEOP|nr:DNA endonuclease RBBP8 [Frankliniella fusca]